MQVAQPGTWLSVSILGMGPAVTAISVVEDLANADFQQLACIRECRRLSAGGDECNFVRGARVGVCRWAWKDVARVEEGNHVLLGAVWLGWMTRSWGASGLALAPRFLYIGYLFF